MPSYWYFVGRVPFIASNFRMIRRLSDELKAIGVSYAPYPPVDFGSGRKRGLMMAVIHIPRLERFHAPSDGLNVIPNPLVN